MISNKISLLPFVREIEDQGTIGSCVANSEVSAIELITYRAHHTYNLSRLGLYHDTLAFEGRLGQEGLVPVDALLVGSDKGIGDESLHVYNTANVLGNPSAAYYADATTHKITHWHSVALSGAAIDAELAKGNPVLIAVDIPKWFMGVVGSVATQNDNLHSSNYGAGWADWAGKHQLLITGRDTTIDGGVRFVENSWGTSWGDNGIGAIKFDDFAYNRPAGSISDGRLNVYAAFVVDGFAGMDFQYTPQREQVTQLYASLFNRAPELSGLDYWASTLTTQSFAQVAQAMYDCTPSRTLYPTNISDTDVIKSFYSNVLGRTADSGGLAYWTGKLAAGQSKGQVITDMIIATDTYSGVDTAALASQSLLDNKTSLGEYYAVSLQADNLNIAQVALVGVTSDVNCLGPLHLGLSQQLGWI